MRRTTTAESDLVADARANERTKLSEKKEAVNFVARLSGGVELLIIIYIIINLNGV